MLYENGTFLILLHNINKQLKYQYRKNQQNQENTIATAVFKGIISNKNKNKSTFLFGLKAIYSIIPTNLYLDIAGDHGSLKGPSILSRTFGNGCHARFLFSYLRDENLSENAPTKRLFGDKNSSENEKCNNDSETIISGEGSLAYITKQSAATDGITLIMADEVRISRAFIDSNYD